MNDPSLLIGPALQAVSADDREAIEWLYAEQDARIEVVRRLRIWDWLGGLPVTLTAVFGLMAFMLLAPLTMIVAGYSQGLAFQIMAGLCALTVLPHWLIAVPKNSLARAFYKRCAMRPAAIIAVGNRDKGPEFLVPTALLVGPREPSPAALARLVDDAQKLATMIDSSGNAPSSLQAFVQSLREAIDHELDDGHRQAVPPEFAQDLEVATIGLAPAHTHSEEFSSRLVFVLYDPKHSGKNSVRAVQQAMWGEGSKTLCDSFEFEKIA